MKVSIKGTAKQIEAFLNKRRDDLIQKNKTKSNLISDTPTVELQEQAIEEKPIVEQEANKDICEWFLQQFTAKLKSLGIDVVYEEYAERYNFNLHSLYINKEDKTFTISEIEYKEDVKLPSVYNLPIPKTESQLDTLMCFFGFYK